MELHLFDFDGTLFRSPDRPSWWGASTWFVEPLSMSPPCVPAKPGSEWWVGRTVSDAKSSIARSDVWAILCTGRALNSGLRYRVPELLKQKGLNFDEVYLNPGGDTKAFKVKVLQQLLHKHPDIHTVQIWEDTNLAHFCKAVESMGRVCIPHPVKVQAMEPLCTQEQIEQLESEGWSRRKGMIDRVAYRYLMRLAGPQVTRSKTACIIAAGEWGGHKCLFKNRDRNYIPKIAVHHEIREGVEVLYLKDEITGWCEGLNEHHVGIVNAALAVAQDEKEKELTKKEVGGATLRDGKRILKALVENNAKSAAEVVKTHDRGLRGHTFIADLDGTISLEATWESSQYHSRQLANDKKHVRTNHGQKYPEAGYTEKDGDNYLSSLARRDQAMKVLRGVDKPTDIAPAIYGKRKKDHSDPFNMVKLTDGMRTSTQMVLDLTALTAHLYLLPEEVDFQGYKQDLPKGYKPKLKLKLYEYGKLDSNGDFEAKAVKLANVDQGAPYISAQLTPMARQKLLKAFPALHGDIRADHMTIWYDPPTRTLERLQPLLGKTTPLKVVGYAADDKGQAVQVATRLPTKGRHPHVTISVSPGTKAVYSNDLLAKGFEKVVGPTLDAILTIQR